MDQRYRFRQLSDSKIAGRSGGVTRWVTTWNDRATVYTVTDYVDEGGFILNDDDPAVVQFLANEREKLAEFSAIANTRGIGEALVAVPEIR